MLTPIDLLILARLYAAATGLSLSTLGKRACGNNRIFLRLAGGSGANVRTLERVETYFRATWPDNASWPEDIRPGLGERRRRRAARAECADAEKAGAQGPNQVPARHARALLRTAETAEHRRSPAICEDGLGAPL
jgi:hypothetical protein